MYFHAGRVIRTEGWQSLLANCPDIANSVVRRLSEFHDESVSARLREERSFGDPFFPINLMQVRQQVEWPTNIRIFGYSNKL